MLDCSELELDSRANSYSGNANNRLCLCIVVCIGVFALTLIVIRLSRLHYKKKQGKTFEKIDKARDKGKRHIDMLKIINDTYNEDIPDWLNGEWGDEEKCDKNLDLLYSRVKYLNYLINSFNVVVTIFEAVFISFLFSVITIRSQDIIKTNGVLKLTAIISAVMIGVLAIHNIIEMLGNNEPAQCLQEYELSLLNEKILWYSKKIHSEKKQDLKKNQSQKTKFTNAVLDIIIKTNQLCI